MVSHKLIRRPEFKRIEFVVDKAVKQLFEYIKNKDSQKSNLILLLSNAEYLQDLKKSGQSPFVIDFRVDEINDEIRLNNITEYLTHAYSFKNENTVDSKFSLSIELMIYTHMWESKPYLKLLKRLAGICEEKDYDWVVKVPDTGKHKFILEVLRQTFKKHNLDVHDIISKGFHTSLRNAFAHSEYSIAINEPTIYLQNFKGAAWELDKISFDEWTIRFCYTFLLGFKIQKRLIEERQNLDHQRPFTVPLKHPGETIKHADIMYDSRSNSFNFKR